MHFYCRESVISSGGQKLNEDRILLLPSMVAVIDGGTQVVPDPLPSPSEGTWIADFVVQNLMQMQTGEMGPRSLLEELSARIDLELESLRWPRDRVPPICSIAILSIVGDKLEAAILGDVSLIYKSNGKATRVLNDRFLMNEKAAFPTRAPDEGLNHDSQINGILERRKGYIVGSNGAGVLSVNKRSLTNAVCATIHPEAGATVMLATDGFMRLLDVYSIVHSIDEILMLACRPGGLGELLANLRRFEAAQKINYSGARKRSDDATATLVEVVG